MEVWPLVFPSSCLGGGNSNIFYVHPYLGMMIPFDIRIFQMGWFNRQPVMWFVLLPRCFSSGRMKTSWWSAACCPGWTVAIRAHVACRRWLPAVTKPFGWLIDWCQTTGPITYDMKFQPQNKGGFQSLLFFFQVALTNSILNFREFYPKRSLKWSNLGWSITYLMYYCWWWTCFRWCKDPFESWNVHFSCGWTFLVPKARTRYFVQAWLPIFTNFCIQTTWHGHFWQSSFCINLSWNMIAWHVRIQSIIQLVDGSGV